MVHQAAPYESSEATAIHIRAVRPEDESLLEEMHAGNSERTLRMRFFGLAPDLTHDDVQRLCRLEGNCSFALAAIFRDAESHAHIVGAAQCVLQADSGAAEFALVVSDAWQRHGLGERLMQQLIAAARRRGVRRLTGQILIENKPMLRLMTKLGFEMHLTFDPTVVEAEISLVNKPR